LFAGGLTLDTTIAQLTNQQKQRLLDVATDFNLDTSAATGSTTLRQVLKAFADAMPTPTVNGQVLQ
jgi:hypothetical protein